MAKSINKSQAEALANGLLDNIGEDKSTFKPKKLLSEVLQIAGEFIENAQNNLNESNSNSTGSLSSSLQITDPQVTGEVLKVDIEMLEYGRYLNKGVKGVVSGSGAYSFKNLYPSRAMISSLMAGKNKASRKITSTNTSKSISQNEKKNKQISDVSKVWGAAVNIKKYGIRPTGFLDKAEQTSKMDIETRLGKALEIDIINTIKIDDDIQ